MNLPLWSNEYLITYIKPNSSNKRDLEPFSPTTAHGYVMTDGDFRAMSSLWSDSDSTKVWAWVSSTPVPSKERSFPGLALGFQSHQLQFGWFRWLCLCFWVRTWTWAPRPWAGLEPHCLGLFPCVADWAWRQLVGGTKAEVGTEEYHWGPGHENSLGSSGMRRSRALQC